MIFFRIKSQRSKTSRIRRGQAAIELMVSLLVILLLVTAALHIGDITSQRSELQRDIRAESGRRSLGPPVFSAFPEYLHSWEPGPDGIRHTADDQPIPNDPFGLRHTIARRSVPDAAAWTWITQSGNPEPAILAQDPLWLSAFALTRTQRRREVPIPPATRRWFGHRESFAFNVEIWMPYLGGLDGHAD